MKSKLSENNGSLLLKLPAGGDADLCSELKGAFSAFEKSSRQTLVVDFAAIKSLSTEMIVLLLEMTARARRNAGDVKVINLRPSALEDLLTFNPKRYLSVTVMGEEETAPDTVDDAARDDSFHSLRRIELPYDEKAIYLATDLATAEAKRIGFSENEISRIKIAVYEACLNAVQHTRTARMQQLIVVEVETFADRLVVRVIDYGRGFKVQHMQDFDLSAAAQKGTGGGMGLHIIRRAMDEIDYQIDPINGNTLTMTKYLNKPMTKRALVRSDQ
ncbi:MAG: ATP-binding protein [candidate division KSB1 bacterium]|nr:ATP-binding protein [candidate division KSB1 bacterium]